MRPSNARAVPTPLAARLLLGAAFVALTAGGALAQDHDMDVAAEVEELVVSGARTLPGQVIGDITPELTISPREIRAYGAANVTELLEALAPQTTSGQGGGRPVVLINGGRVSGFNEIRDLPTEAIARVEILPEEVSLKYGYPAEQKVVNMVLRQRFRATLAEGSATTPTQSGGGATVAGHAGLLRILRGERLMLDAKATHVDPIYESDRDIIGGQGSNRSLQSESNDVTLSAVWAKPFDNGVSATVNGVFESNDSEARLGLSPFTGLPLLRNSDAEDARLAASANGAYSGWQWSYTGELAYNDSRTDTDRALNGQSYTDWTKAITKSVQSDMVLNRALWRLPAGQIGSTLTARASYTELDSDALRAGLSTSNELSRSIGELKANFDVPLTRADEGLGERIGKLSANVNMGVQHLSDFGDLSTVGAGLNWTPIKPVRVLASFSRTDQAPTMNQLGDPVIATPDVRVFDFETGQTAEVIRISGGNRNLDSGQKDIFKLGVTYKPFDKTNLTFQANYVSTRTHDAIAAFPSASTQVEDAFPERFFRNAEGELVQVDARPVNFERQARDEIRWGFTYSRPVGPQPSPEAMAQMRRRMAEARAGDQQGGRPPEGAPAEGGLRPPQDEGGPDRQPQGGEARPGGGETQGPQGGGSQGQGPGGGGFGARGPGGPGGPGFGGFGGGRRGGVLQIGVYHTYAFRDDVLIRQGVPELDLLNGGALGQGGGSPEHQVDVQANYSRGGLGVAANAKWQSSTNVVGGSSGEDLKFSDMTTVNLRLFADLGMQPIAREHKWLRGMRATIAINNLFDERQEVRNSSGVTPISYQPDLLDPVGRSVRFTIRKLIF